MKRQRISETINYLNESIIDEATNFQKAKITNRTVWMKWTAVAACLCIVVVGLFYSFDNHESPFVLTAYALSEDNTPLLLEMKEGKSVPINTFVADNGMEGFIFSHKKQKTGEGPLVSIVSADFMPYIMSDDIKSTSAEQIEKINTVDLEKTQQYIFFVPSVGESAPYSITISVYDEETNISADLTIVIEYAENGFSAKIEKINRYEILEDIDELLKPYQEVIDRLNAEYDCKLYIPEDRKYSVYEEYKGLSQEEFEKRILEELQGVTSEGADDGGMNFDYFPASS